MSNFKTIGCIFLCLSSFVGATVPVPPVPPEPSAATTGPPNDHGELLGLPDDDHEHYLLASGARDLAGDLIVQDDTKILFRNFATYVNSPSTNALGLTSGFETLFNNFGEQSMMLWPFLLAFGDGDPIIDTALSWTFDNQLRVMVAGLGQVIFTDGTFEPVLPNDIDLGRWDRMFKDAHLEGNLYLGDTATGLHELLGDLVYSSDQLHEFQIAGVSQVAFGDDTFTFQQGANNVGFTWGTASELDFQIDGIPKVTLTGNTLEPVEDDNIHFGTETHRFKEAHYSGDVFVGALHSSADDGGVVGSVSTTNDVTPSGSGATAKLGKLAGLEGGPTNLEQAGWVKFYIGMDEAWYPYWK